MYKVTSGSLAGGMGKTTAVYFLGRLLARMGNKILMIDADPQSSLTFYLGHDVKPNEPTLLEVIKGEVEVGDGIYETPFSGVSLIPSDRALKSANEYLGAKALGEVTLRNRLKKISQEYDCCIIDSPPQGTKVCLAAFVAADGLLIPAEASSKGLNSLDQTLELVYELQEVDAFQGSVLAVLPFRDKWTGRNQARRSATSIQAMASVAEGIPVLLSILESEQYKQALDSGKTLAEMGHPDLENPLKQVVELIKKQCPSLKTQLAA